MLKGSQRILNYLSASQNSHTNAGQMFKMAILKGERETKPKDTDGNTRGGKWWIQDQRVGKKNPRSLHNNMRQVCGIKGALSVSFFLFCSNKPKHPELQILYIWKKIDVIFARKYNQVKLTECQGKILWLFLKTVVTIEKCHCNDHSRAQASMTASLHHCLWLEQHRKPT